MDILDVGLTIKEFRMEWTIKYTPNDITFWAPLLDSDLPTQKACAFELFLAWGRESVVEAYEKWSKLRDMAEELQKQQEKETAEKHARYEREQERLRDYENYYGDDDCGCYDCEEYETVSTYSSGKRITVRTMRQLNKKYTDFEISLMTWETYFNKFVLGKGV